MKDQQNTNSFLLLQHFHFQPLSPRQESPRNRETEMTESLRSMFEIPHSRPNNEVESLSQQLDNLSINQESQKIDGTKTMGLFPSYGDKNVVMIETFFLSRFEKEEEEKKLLEVIDDYFPKIGQEARDIEKQLMKMIMKRPMKTIRLINKHIRHNKPQFQRIIQELRENGQLERLSQKYREELEFLRSTYEIESAHRATRKMRKHLARYDEGDVEMDDEEMQEDVSTRRRKDRRKREIWRVKQGCDPYDTRIIFVKQPSKLQQIQEEEDSSFIKFN